MGLGEAEEVDVDLDAEGGAVFLEETCTGFAGVKVALVDLGGTTASLVSVLTGVDDAGFSTVEGAEGPTPFGRPLCFARSARARFIVPLLQRVSASG